MVWEITEAGDLEIRYVDNGSVITLRRVEKSNDTSTVLVRHSSSVHYLNEVSMMVKRDAPKPTDISDFLGKFCLAVSMSRQLTTSVYLCVDQFLTMV